MIHLYSNQHHNQYHKLSTQRSTIAFYIQITLTSLRQDRILLIKLALINTIKRELLEVFIEQEVRMTEYGTFLSL